MQIVKEGLKAGDLDGVVSKRFSVDQFKSKMGEDMNIMVLAFTVDGMAPAKDLERFAETGYKEVLDADATPGTLAKTANTECSSSLQGRRISGPTHQEVPRRSEESQQT